jgi:hypothetical protein
MNRNEFMSQLDRLLQDLPIGERAEAMQYYSDYFSDAGVENEQEVMDTLGSPEKVAETIRKELYENSEGEKRQFYASDRVLAKREAFKKKGESEDKTGRFDGKDESLDYGSTYDSGKNCQDNGTNDFYSSSDENSSQDHAGSYGAGSRAAEYAFKIKAKTGISSKWLVIIAILLVCVIAVPLLFKVLGGILSALIGIVAGWFGVILGLGGATLGCLVGGVALIIMGCLMAVGSPVLGLGMVGGGFLAIGIGLCFLVLTVLMVGKVTPAMARFLKKLWDRFYTYIKKRFGK